jgi:hypothetical protein
VIESLREKFVPIAVDQHVHRRLKNAEGELFAKVLKQAGRDLGGRSQGVYIFDPAGKLLAFSNTSDAGQVKRLMAKALTGFESAAADSVPVAAKVASPPAGTTIVTVTSKVLGGYEKVDGRNTEMHAASLGRDHLWIRGDEAAALAKGLVPATLTQRLVRYHLIDNTRGEPPFWRSEELREAKLELKDGRLSGRIELRSSDGEREYVAELFGQLVTDGGKLTRFDLVANGEFQGESRYTRGAPPGKYPFAVSFRVTAPTCAADRVIPGGARGNLARYLR